MTTQHTAGPWVAKTYSTETVRDAVGIYAGSMPLPVVPDIAGRSIDECDANIRLIAAAPDLLIALRDLLEDAVALGICESNMSGSAVAARAAIAKATGGAP